MYKQPVFTHVALQAREKGVKLIDESGLFSLFKAAPEPKAPAQPAASSAPAAVPSSLPPAQAASQKGKAAAAGMPAHASDTAYMFCVGLCACTLINACLVPSLYPLV